MRGGCYGRLYLFFVNEPTRSTNTLLNCSEPTRRERATAMDEHGQQRTCSSCNLTKPVSEFNFKQRATLTRHSYCRECGKQLTRRHYARNKRAYLDRNARTYLRHRQLIRAAKSRPCADCSIQYPYYVMDFDHRDGASKEFALNSVSRKTERAILREMEKCDVVCANCHRERTHQRSLKKKNV